jgi:plastocyanin
VSAVLLAAAVGLGLLPTAQAASVTITLSFQAPSPSNAAAATSDTIVFSNNDQVAHAVKSKTGAWSFSRSVPAGASYSVKLPTTAGTFTYSDTHNVPIFGATVDSGTVTSTAPKPPPPTATPKPASTATPKPTAKPSATPRATASAQPTASGSPTAGAPTPGSGTALAPGLGTGILTTGTPSPGAPQPNIAPALPSTTAAPAVGATAAPAVRYADRPLTQDSTHRYGLPALLAVLALTGVASLLVRYLLAHRDPQAPQD